ncbi:MAG: hypothetical protein EA360_10030 [Balneolaceae bacterium]|nr:MAG: hypothetical protein EA360_10030 [Balneolaceae bacterium]
MKRLFPILFSVILLQIVPVSTALAQAERIANTGSFYSGVGFGMPTDIFSPYSMGMGLSGVSNYSGFSTNIANPAQWGLLAFTQGSLVTGLNHFNAADSRGTSQNTRFGVEQFQITFPVLRDRLGVSVSVTPIIRSDYRFRSGGLFEPIAGTSNLIRYDFEESGSGGVNRIEAGAGLSLTNNISVGYAFSANILSISNSVFPQFSESQYRASPFDRKTQGYGFGHRFGLYAFTGPLFRSSDQLALGATVTLPLTIDAEELVTGFRSVNGNRQLIDFNQNSPLRNASVKMPLEINTGLTYNLNRFTNIVAELMMQRWGEATYGFDNVQQDFFKDRLRTGVGFQYHPYRSNQPGGFFSNFKYSAGITYDTGHLKMNNLDIETLTLHAGVGIMSFRTASSIDLSFFYGMRGTDSSSLVKEDIWGFKLSLNLAEYMFVRQLFQ